MTNQSTFFSSNSKKLFSVWSVSDMIVEEFWATLLCFSSMGFAGIRVGTALLRAHHLISGRLTLTITTLSFLFQLFCLFLYLKSLSSYMTQYWVLAAWQMTHHLTPKYFKYGGVCGQRNNSKVSSSCSKPEDHHFTTMLDSLYEVFVLMCSICFSPNMVLSLVVKHVNFSLWLQSISN